MAQIDFQPEDVLAFLKEVEKNTEKISAAVTNIDKAIKIVDGKWHGDSHEAFGRFYKDWRKGVDTLSVGMKQNLEVIRNMAETYQKL
jgi:uncharacterized protein YukE